MSNAIFWAVLTIAVLPEQVAGSIEKRRPQVSPDQQVQSAERDYVEKMTGEAGLEPLSQVARERREVKRVLYTSTFPRYPPLGVQIERQANGSVLLTLYRQNRTSVPVPVPAASWDKLTALQAELSETKSQPRGRARQTPSTPVQISSTCHPIDYHFGTVRNGRIATGGWHSCSPADPKALDYAGDFAKLALSTLPKCKAEAPEFVRSLVICMRTFGL